MIKSVFIFFILILTTQNLYSQYKTSPNVNMQMAMKVRPGVRINVKNMGFPSQYGGYNPNIAHTGQTSAYPGGDNGYDGSVQVQGPVGVSYTITWPYYNTMTNGTYNITFTIALGLTYMGSLNTFTILSGATRVLPLPNGTDNMYVRGIVPNWTYYPGSYSGVVPITVTYQ